VDVIDRGGRGDIICRPNGEAYAHLAVEVFEALALARQRGARVTFVKPDVLANPALLDIVCDGVPVRHAEGLRASMLRARMNLAAGRARRRRARAARAQRGRLELARELHRQLALRDLPAGVKEFVRAWRDHLQAAEPVADDAAALYYRRTLLRQPLPIRLRPEVEAAALETARAIGIDPDRPLVAIHAREGGYKRGREMQDRKPGKRDDSQRNARIESYDRAIDYLLARGYQVVRIGDPTMAPLARRDVVDVAVDPRRTPALDLWVLLRSRFLVSGESGPLGVSFLTDTPCLVVNATDPISTFPIRRSGLYIVKHVIDIESGRELTLDELLSEHHYRHLRNTARFAYRDNTAQEILAAVREMDDSLDRPWGESGAQARFRERVTAAALHLRTRVRYVAKWGIDDGFLGDGRVARSYAERALGD
jgi:putative glycosyltransferase (TIGR04372 family)